MKQKICSDLIELREILKIHDELTQKEFSPFKLSENTHKLCLVTNDQYLNYRGNIYKECIEHDKEIRNLLGKLEYSSITEDYIGKYFNEWCLKKRTVNYENELNFIDLFCGAGGLSLGFIQEGFVVNLANDIDSSCVETYRFNHPSVESKYIINGDVNDLKKDLLNKLRYKKVDVVIGGPPCQGFSIANQQRLIDDPRNILYKSFVDIVSIANPKIFVMENVKGMLKVANQVKRDFEQIGYTTNFAVLKAQNFSIPQNRERLIFVGSKLYNPINIIESLKKVSMPSYTLFDAIGDLNPLLASTTKNNTCLINDVNGGIVIKKKFSGVPSEYVTKINCNKVNSRVLFNHQARYNNERDIEIYSRLQQGDNSNDPKIADIMPYLRRQNIFKDKYYKLRYDSICKTITAHMKFDCNMYIHPNQARGLTPREAARVQSYPDDYVFKGSYTKTYMQIGNSVPPLMGRYIAKAIKNTLKGDSSHA